MSKLNEESVATVAELKKTLKEKVEEISVLQERVTELIKVQIAYQNAKVEYEKLQSNYENLWLKLREQTDELEYLRDVNAKLKEENDHLVKELEGKVAVFAQFVEESNAERSKVNSILESIMLKKARAKTEETIKKESRMTSMKKAHLSEYLDRLKWVTPNSVLLPALRRRSIAKPSSSCWKYSATKKRKPTKMK